MRRATVPLPPGFNVVFDQDTQFIGGGMLFGGSPTRLLRLDRTEARALAELRRGPVGSVDSGRLARRLTDAGFAHPRPPAAVPADVTVVIPVRDRPAGLARCLSALGACYQVIVVDDGSVDQAAVADLCEKHGAALKRRPLPGGAGPARNDGLALVTTPFVAFIDSDCAAGPEWIRQLLPHFADPMIGAVAPRVRPVTGPGTTGRYLDARPPIDLGPREALVAPRTRVSYLSTAALLVRRDAIGTGFDPDLRFGEDVDLIWRMIGAGWRVRYDPAGLVSHTEPLSWTRVLARRFRYGRSAAPLSRKHPGRVPPLILQAWPAVSVGALLARRPAAGLAAYGAGTAQLVDLLHEWGVPPKGVLRPMAGSVRETWLVLGRWSIQFALPAVTAGICWQGGQSGLAKTARRLALASLIAGPPAAEWLRNRPALDPARFVLAYLADEAAYGAGVYRGALTERTVAPLIPQIAWHPLPKPGEETQQ